MENESDDRPCLEFKTSARIDDDEYQRQFLASQERTDVFLRAISRHLRNVSEMDSDAMQLPQAEVLTHLLELVATQPSGVPDDRFVEFATKVVPLMGTIGATGYREHDQVVRAIDAAIGRFESSGRSTVRLLLTKATFVSFERNESRVRFSTLRQAEQIAVGHELYEAWYWLSWYHLDSSRYSRARRLCDRAMSRAVEKGDVRWQAVFLASRGLVKYTTLYTPTSARRDLEQATNSLRSMEQDPIVVRSLSEGLHYLGRLAHDRGEITQSLQLYIEGNRFRASLPFETRATAYHHIRMAETLIGARNPTEATEHLKIAEDLLDRIGDIGSARVSLSYARANLLAYRGDREDALIVLRETAKEATRVGFARGRLMALARLCTLNWQMGNRGQSIVMAAQAIPLLLDGELARNSTLGILTKFQGYALRVTQPYTPRKTGDAVLCPCGAH